MKEVIQDSFTMKLYAHHIELLIKPETHLENSVFFQILHVKISHYDDPVGLIVVREGQNHYYSIDPLIFLKFKTQFETHLKWYALVSPNKSGFQNLVYLKQMTNLKVYSFTNYEDALSLIEE